jgi:NAD(P)-dependent dehydrogenase (short-subunit alcohol dehydrogenase family)
MKVIITGCGKTESLGNRIAKSLRNIPNYEIIGMDKEYSQESLSSLDEHITCDISDYYSVASSLDSIECDILINCAAINRIAWLEDLDHDGYDEIMDTNAKSIYNTSKSLLSTLSERKGTILNIVSNASHMPMTCSLAYNASKGAAHIMTLQLARELTKKHGITVFGISPNKLEGTGMSKYIDSRVPATRGWTEQQSKDYQLGSLLAGEETDPDSLAEFIAFLLSSKKRHKYLTGCILPYGA